MGALSKRMRVLITVKTAPEPSTKYIETVCVAGVRVDRRPFEFVRLYPIPFRYLEGDRQFRKWQVIEVDTRSPLLSSADHRGESRSVDVESIARFETLESRRARWRVLEDVSSRTMCSLVAGVKADLNATSLGLVRVKDFKGVDVVPGTGWSLSQQRKLNLHRDRVDLFDEGSKVRELEAPRFQAKARYTCFEEGCRGHQQGILDWELSALQLRLQALPDAEAIAEIQTKFFDQKVSHGMEPFFFVGNQGNVARRATFSVLGIQSFQPGMTQAPTLDLGV